MTSEINTSQRLRRPWKLMGATDKWKPLRAICCGCAEGPKTFISGQNVYFKPVDLDGSIRTTRYVKSSGIAVNQCGVFLGIINTSPALMS